MNSNRQRVANNRIVRRLRRHTGLTTLFRKSEAYEPAPSSFVSPILPRGETANPVEMFVGPEDLVMGLNVPAAVPPLESPSQAVRQRLVQPVHSLGPASTLSRVPVQAVVLPSLSLRDVSPHSSPVPEAASPQVQSVGDNDPSWRQLQKIHDLHQAKDAAELDQPTSAGRDTLAIQRKSTTLEQPPTPRSPENGPAQLDNRPGATPIPSASPVSTSVSQPGVTFDVVQPEKPASNAIPPSQKSNSRESTRFEQVASTKANEVKTHSDDPDLDHPIATEILPNPSIADQDNSGQSQPLLYDGQEKSSLVIPTQQPQPLEDVWPVQRRAERPPAPTPSESVPIADTPPTELADPRLAQNIQQVLQRVTTEQPTQSTIEVVTPRRARPIQDQTTTNPILSGRSNTPSLEVEMVPTDIGPLPSDLWDLLGQNPPQVTDQTEGDTSDLSKSTPTQRASMTDQPKIQTKAETTQPVNTSSLPVVAIPTISGQDSPETQSAQHRIGFSSGMDQPSVSSQALPEALSGTLMPVDEVPDSAPPKAKTKLSRVIEVQGSVQASPSGPPPSLDEQADHFDQIQRQLSAPNDPLVEYPTGESVSVANKPTANAGLSRSATHDTILPQAPIPFDKLVSDASQIQRQAETLAVDGAPVGTERLEADQETDIPAEAAESVDTDELARHVYQKIRNRLTVEWERLRRR